MYIKYKKVHKLAIPPHRANPSDAGMDVFYAPDDPEARAYKHGVTIHPGASARLKTGLQFEVPHGYMLQAMNRSSVAAKRNLIVGAHVIDSGYSGEVFIDLHNVGDKPQTIEKGEKIAQLVMVKIELPIPMESDSIYDNPVCISDRGDGALGSTDG